MTAAVLPDRIEPMLATLVNKPRAGANWLYEIKFDGYRMLGRVDGRSVRLFTRNGLDWTERLAPLQQALAASRLASGWYDGEIVVLDKGGLPDFHALQNAFGGRRAAQVVYFIFDAPYLAGCDLRLVALEDRRDLVQAALQDAHENVRFSQSLGGDAASVLASACKLGLEGVIGKRCGSHYVHGRSSDWIKLKCGLAHHFVIGGYRMGGAGGTRLGCLLLGLWSSRGLEYAGSVGTGFRERDLRQLMPGLTSLATPVSPFFGRTGYEGRASWVRPDLVCEVSFQEWTRSGGVRHSAYQGLKAVPAQKVTREDVSHAPRRSRR